MTQVELELEHWEAKWTKIVNLRIRVVHTSPSITTIGELLDFMWIYNILWSWNFETFQSQKHLKMVHIRWVLHFELFAYEKGAYKNCFLASNHIAVALGSLASDSERWNCEIRVLKGFVWRRRLQIDFAKAFIKLAYKWLSCPWWLLSNGSKLCILATSLQEEAIQDLHGEGLSWHFEWEAMIASIEERHS